MRHAAERAPQRRRGFLLPVVLGLLLVAAVLALHALSGTAGAAALSTNRLLHQRAFEAAERGLAALRQRIDDGETAPVEPVRLDSPTLASVHAIVGFRETARLTAPPGFSSGRFVEERAELHSIGRSTSAATARLVEGISRILPGEDEACAPAAIDLDGDGRDDRLYAADLSGRIWRLDLRAGDTREDWSRANLFADLSGDGLRGFQTTPDLTLHSGPSGETWLGIAIGSRSIGALPGANRFYVLRDDAELSPRSTPPPPIREADLLLAESHRGTGPAPVADRSADEGPRGYYLPLGVAEVYAPALTLNGVTVFTAALRRIPGNGCDAAATGPPAAIEARAIVAASGAAAFDLNADGRRDERDAMLLLPGLHAAASAVRVSDSLEQADRPGEAGRAADSSLRPCLVGGEPIPGCALDTRTWRRYWLREDTD